MGNEGHMEILFSELERPEGEELGLRDNGEI